MNTIGLTEQKATCSCLFEWNDLEHTVDRFHSYSFHIDTQVDP